MAANTMIVGDIPQHYEFRLRLQRGAPVRVPLKERTFWERGPQEALEHAKRLLGIEGKGITSLIFQKAGGATLEKVLMDDDKPTKKEVIYPL